MSHFPRELVLSFVRNKQKETVDSGAKWQASIYGRRDGKTLTTVFVPDAISQHLPANSEQCWRCTVGEEPRFQAEGLTLYTVDLEELVWEGNLDLTFGWVRAAIPGGFRFQWQTERRVAGRLTTFVVDRKAMDDPDALKPTPAAGCAFRCRITRQIWVSDDRGEQVLAVKPLKQFSPPPSIPVARQKEELVSA